MNANQRVIHTYYLKGLDLIVNLHFKWPLPEMQELPSECYQYKASLCLPLQEIFLFMSVSHFPLCNCWPI